MNDLNAFFASVFQNCPALDSVDEALSDLPSHPLSVEAFEMESYLRKLKKGNGGPSGIPYFVFKENSFLLATPIAILFNKCVKLGCFPSFLKNADVVPIPKIPRPTEVSHFRPISILPVLSKIFEKIVLSKWILPFVSHKVSSTQFAYFPRVGNGTTCALTFLYHKILQFLDKESGAVRVLAVDFSKAFDKLPTNSILSSLISFGVPREAVIFILSFLTNRFQRVSSEECSSNWSKVTSGVPQGSVLGPILFALVVDSLSPVCSNSFCLKYADDVTFLHFVRDDSDDVLQCEWNNLEMWSNEVGLFLNFDKCCVMNCVTKRSLSLKPLVTANLNEINTVSSVRLLGVTFSSDLSWNDHFSSVITRCYKRFFILRNLKRAKCSPFLLHKCYIAFIRSIMLYAMPCFCNAPKYLFDRLLRVERRASRYFADYCFTDFATTMDRVCYKLFNNVHIYEDHPLRIMFESRARTSRNARTLRPPFAASRRFSKSFIRFAKV